MQCGGLLSLCSSVSVDSLWALSTIYLPGFCILNLPSLCMEGCAGDKCTIIRLQVFNSTVWGARAGSPNIIMCAWLHTYSFSREEQTWHSQRYAFTSHGIYHGLGNDEANIVGLILHDRNLPVSSHVFIISMFDYRPSCKNLWHL